MCYTKFITKESWLCLMLISELYRKIENELLLNADIGENPVYVVFDNEKYSVDNVNSFLSFGVDWTNSQVNIKTAPLKNPTININQLYEKLHQTRPFWDRKWRKDFLVYRVDENLLKINPLTSLTFDNKELTLLFTRGN